MHIRTRFLPLALAAAVAACSTLPERDLALENARMARDAARDNADVRAYAQLEYKRADDTFHAADAAWQNRDHARKVDHLAYLAQRQSEVAVEVGKQKATAATE